MSKKLTKSIASIACAALMASQMFAFNASAIENNGGYYYYYNGVYYSYPVDADTASGVAGTYEAVPTSRVPAGATEKYIDPRFPNKYYDSEKAAKDAGIENPHVVYIGTYYGNYPSATGAYYSSYTNKYYRTYSEALAASNNNSTYVSYVANYYGNSYYGYYYSTYTGKYYSTYSAALAASNGNAAYVTYVGNSAYGRGYYYSTYTGKYYTTYEAALAASNNNSSFVTYVGGAYDGNASSIYRYYYNGVAYPSLDAAIAAGGTALGVDISYVPYNYYGKHYNYGYGYYGYGYLTDPYLMFRKDPFSTSTSISKTDAAEDGEPYLYGNKNYAGWKTIVKYINKAKKGANIKVDMNGCSVVDKSVFDALDGRNVSVTFVLDNGVKWTVNGKNVDTPQDVTIYTEYNIDYIPASLVKKASNGAVSKAQVGVSTSFNDFGTTASVTVKFNKKRADLTAVVYRYNPDSKSLKAVYKTKVQSDGSCTFTVDQGGPYLIVLK